MVLPAIFIFLGLIVRLVWKIKVSEFMLYGTGFTLLALQQSEHGLVQAVICAIGALAAFIIAMTTDYSQSKRK